MWSAAWWWLLACGSSEPARLDDPPPLDDRLGLCDAWDVPVVRSVDDLRAADGDLDEAIAAGLGVARPHRPGGHVFALDVVAADDGTYDFTLPDHLVATAGARGVALYVTLEPRSDLRPEGAPAPNHPRMVEEELPRWRAFVGAIVERYDGDGVQDGPAGRVLAWEVGNEPSCKPGNAVCHDRYRALVQATYEAAKAADPAATVVWGGAAPLFPFEDGRRHAGTEALYRGLVASGGLAYTDAVVFHLPPGSPAPEVDAYIDAWRGIVGDKPLWIGEIGTRDPLGRGRFPSPADAARWLPDNVARAFERGVERVFWCKSRGRLTDNPAQWNAMRELFRRMPR